MLPLIRNQIHIMATENPRIIIYNTDCNHNVDYVDYLMTILGDG